MEKTMKQIFRVALALTAMPLLAQTSTQNPPPAAQPPVFQESVEVRVMDLDVAVTDSKGNPVSDLGRQDFRVQVEGKPVPIDYFARVDAGTIHAPDLASASPDRVLEIYRKGEEVFVPRHFLIYVDSGDVSPGTRNRALEQLRDFVTRLGPTDTARVVLFDRRAKDLTDWTSSKETLLAAIDSMEKGVGMARLQNELQTLRVIDSTRGRGRFATARSYADEEFIAVDTMIKDMRAQLATLTPLPGKKAFLFVSGSLPDRPGEAMLRYATGGFSSAAIFEARQTGPQIEQLAREANASEITFYTVDAKGLVTEGATASNDDPLAMRSNVSFFARQEAQSGLLSLAQETGGLALLNTNDIRGGLGRIYQDASSYYSIGVNLSSLPKTGYQNVRVDVNRPGLNVRYRRGYAQRSPEDRATDIARAALRTNVFYRSVPVKLQIGASAKAKKHYSQPITVILPASALTFVPSGETSKATADIYVGAIDDTGRTSDISRQEATFTLASNASPDAALTYPMTLEMRKGNSRVVVNVRDKATGKMGTARADVHIE